jgi:predicted MFS family arabinose efflux permease
LPYVKSGSKNSESKKIAPARMPYHDRVYLTFIGLTILFASCFFQMFTMISLFYKTQWHFSELFIGALMAINGITIVAFEMVLIYSIEKAKPHTYFISIGIAIVGLGFALLNVVPHVAWAAVISVMVLTLGEIMSMPFMNSFWISRTSEDNRGRYAAMYTIAWSIAQIAAPTFGSQIVANKGYPTLLWLLFAVCLLAAAGFRVLGRRYSSAAVPAKSTFA